MFVIVPESLDFAIDEIIRKAEPEYDPRAEKFNGIRSQLVGLFNDRGTFEGVSIEPTK